MFITFEGLDGSGKTTILNKIYHKLLVEYPNLKIVKTREPGGENVPEAEKLREMILHNNTKLSNESEALLYTACRRMHLEKLVWPSLAEGKIVFCDRYLDSFFAYQGFARGLGYDFVKQLSDLVVKNTYPDLTIFFDISPQEARERREGNRLIIDRLEKEKEDFHKKVYNGYQTLINEQPNRFLIVDASKTADEVFKDVYNALISNPKFQQYLKQHD
ncbi:dTMP kinase [Mycoplasma buteonis]|uniref:dTMP kinase n=1 Tax=Mycoplasma buteonis TaxID=171280 RepID=UPI00056C892D|nr:dTMP kinase [Mycoplasma buteonis]